LNSTLVLTGIVSVAIVAPLGLAAVLAFVMTWLSRQVPGSTSATPEAPAKKPAPKPAPVSAPTGGAPAAPPVHAEQPPAAEMAEAELFATEAATFEKEETHRRVVPVWLAVVYAIVIVWALVYVGIEVLPFFKPLTPQSAPPAAPAAIVPGAPSAPQVAAAPGKGNAANGEKLYTAQGCAACHSLKQGEKIVGPSHYRVSQSAAERLKASDYRGQAKTAQDYLRESIMDTNLDLVPGFAAGLMPPDFAKRLSAQEIEDLVAFLMTK